MRRRAPGLGALLAASVLAALACGGESRPGPPPAVILQDPQGAAVFEGQVALFRVRALGTVGLAYQWRRNGIPIPGATDSHLATQPTVPGDDGALYSVTVTNTGAASRESRPAHLTVRPPLDLRFQWVGAPYAPAYGLETNLLVGSILTYQGTGSPLLVGTGICAGPGNCSWELAVTSPIPGMTITYATGAIQDVGTGWASALPGDTIVTSLDLEEPSGVYAASLGQTTQAGEFVPVVQGSVPPDQLQAAATSEGAQGRVVTAASFRGGLVWYVSYGWSRDVSTVYEAQVVASAFGTLRADAEGLAAQGYVITALGAGDGGASGLVLVGTRAQGNTAPRPIAVVSSLAQVQGYAVVGILFDAAALTWTWIGER